MTKAERTELIHRAANSIGGMCGVIMAASTPIHWSDPKLIAGLILAATAAYRNSTGDLGGFGKTSQQS